MRSSASASTTRNASAWLVALRRGARIVLVNLEETPLLREKVDFLQGSAGVILPLLIQEMWPGSFKNLSPLRNICMMAFRNIFTSFLNSDQSAFFISSELRTTLRNARHEAALASLACDIFFSIGTSGMAEPAASLPLVALRRGARVVLVNPEETPLLSEKVDFLRGPAGAVLPALLQEYSAP